MFENINKPASLNWDDITNHRVLECINTNPARPIQMREMSVGETHALQTRSFRQAKFIKELVRLQFVN